MGQYQVAVWFKVRATTEEEAHEKVDRFCQRLKQELGPDFVETTTEVEK